MDKKHIEEIKKIDIPKEDLLASISKGIEKGRKENWRKRKYSFKTLGVVSATAASALLASGIIFTPVSNVLAAVPFIGSFYEQHNMQIAQELEESKLISEVNQVVVDQGIQVTLSSAYYDGNVIGTAFMVDGDAVSVQTIQNAGPEAGYTMEIFDGVEQEQWASSSTGLTEAENGFIVAIEFFNPDAALTKMDELPVTFTSIAGVQGEWEFAVPLQQISSEAILVKGVNTSEHDGYALTINSLSKGEATTLVSYDMTLPLGRETDEIRLTIFDDKGTLLGQSHADVLQHVNNKETIEKTMRKLFTSEISDTAKYLIIQPEISKGKSGSKLIKMDPIRVDLTNQ
ncbi:DUF4179 domain-containing protein [Planococcus sp. CPCC 101016]|uniref:DUF4179 domain-containing protein n=1 Tax=Planococcus sp. CPCC 101016 TaxID=2599617 RepID=UPI0011B65A53|nr:DUF4179 domain-containing protein [Planococcus sp. CPCC 101016]TWT05271.1 DUF4179 domain-containing protein [Planococcus sp. CPCC 101016]